MQNTSKSCAVDDCGGSLQDESSAKDSSSSYSSISTPHQSFSSRGGTESIVSDSNNNTLLTPNLNMNATPESDLVRLVMNLSPSRRLTFDSSEDMSSPQENPTTAETHDGTIEGVDNDNNTLINGDPSCSFCSTPSDVSIEKPITTTPHVPSIHNLPVPSGENDDILSLRSIDSPALVSAPILGETQVFLSLLQILCYVLARFMVLPLLSCLITMCQLAKNCSCTNGKSLDMINNHTNINTNDHVHENSGQMHHPVRRKTVSGSSRVNHSLDVVLDLASYTDEERIDHSTDTSMTQCSHHHRHSFQSKSHNETQVNSTLIEMIISKIEKLRQYLSTEIANFSNKSQEYGNGYRNLIENELHHLKQLERSEYKFAHSQADLISFWSQR